jgi:crotonobetainyl-CoA:carnitine CoA-transferase CaiB-like acyl-CoA transferase
MAGLLDGIVVVELADPLTEYGGSLLAGLGAEVILVEPPGGAATRLRRPFAPGATASRQSIPFLARNAGKKSVALDPEDSTDIATLARLLEHADGILEGHYSPFHAVATGLAAKTPRVAITDATGLGTSGIVAFAASGGLSSSGWPHQPPCNAPGWLMLDGASIYAAVMLLVAIRANPEPNARWEIPLQEAAIATATPWTRPLHSYGMTVAGQGVGSARLGAGPYPILACRDGYVRVLTGTPKQWEAWIKLLGEPEVLALPEWKSPQYRAANYDTMVAVASEIVAARGMLELFREGQALGLTISPVMDVQTFMADPHVRARQVFAAIDDPELGAVELMRPAYRLEDGSPASLAPAPALGEHTERASARLHPRTNDKSKDAGNPLAPLAGVRVLDCGVGAVVPEAASMLALLGAEVIKVESRKHVDFLRQSGLNGLGDFNNAPTFNQMNLGVLSLALDVTTEDGRAVLARLAATCDIVMENMRGPVMGKWGVDYDSVKALNPDVIYMSSQGLGDGPYGGFQTYGPNLQTFSGVTNLWAHPDDPYPVGTTLNHPDHVAGKQFLTAILAALLRRDRTGEGCYLDCAQFEAAASLIGDKFLQHQLLPGTARAMGNASPDMAPHGCYPCAGDDRWCAIAVEDDAQWARFRKAMGEPWADDPGFATADTRLSRREELDALVGRWTAKREPAEVESTLRAVGVPVSRVVRGDDLVADASLHGDGLFTSLPHPTADARFHTGLPIVHETAGRIPVRRSPLLGEHDEYVLFEVLGMSPDEVSVLVDTRVAGY